MKRDPNTRPGTVFDLWTGVGRLQIRQSHPWPMKFLRREGSTLFFKPDNSEGCIVTIRDSDLYNKINHGRAHIIVYLPTKG